MSSTTTLVVVLTYSWLFFVVITLSLSKGTTTVITTASPKLQPKNYYDCDFENKNCTKWKVDKGDFKIVTGHEVNNSWVPVDGPLAGPFTDADNNTQGHFLYWMAKSKRVTGTKEILFKSAPLNYVSDSCMLSLWLHMNNMSNGTFKVVIQKIANNTQWFIAEQPGNDSKTWYNQTYKIGKISTKFHIILIVAPGESKYPQHVAIDNIKLHNCIPEPDECQPHQYECPMEHKCIDKIKVCNIEKDCKDGWDESHSHNCHEVPSFARCTFEDGWCGWHNKHENHLNWTLHNGSTPTTSTGPSNDHTLNTPAGVYLYVDMTGRAHDMGTPSELESPIINPPPRYHSNISSPYYNSCYITFFYHKFGQHSGSLGLFLVELQRTNITTKLWWSFGDKGNQWLRQNVTLPNVTSRYYFQFEARKSFASRGDPAIDDISLSPQCFGIGVSESHLQGYSYENYDINQFSHPREPPQPSPDFVNQTYYKFTPCGATGRKGPTPENCSVEYNNTDVKVTVMTERLMAGIQRWVVPKTGYYTVIAMGASGGAGSGRVQATSRGAMVWTVVELTKGQILYILVGQEGQNACRKYFASKGARTICLLKTQNGNDSRSNSRISKIAEVKRLKFLPEGGGGGGASFVFTVLKNKEKKPIIVAGGGGGFAHNSAIRAFNPFEHGQSFNSSLPNLTGEAESPKGVDVIPAGPGGGWSGRSGMASQDSSGLALLQGGIGGTACYTSSDGSDKGAGGFGGGGGACTSGGGGGGWTGGRAYYEKGKPGEGGHSWIEMGMFNNFSYAPKRGPGAVYIIPAISGCGCDYRCVALDPYRSTNQCLCPTMWYLANDTLKCLLNTSSRTMTTLETVSIGVIAILAIVIAVFCIFLYNRYQKTRDSAMRRKMLTGPDLQLNRLRVASDSMVTEYNPNYEFGGGIYNLRELKPIPREQLRLVKALGQGAFGEVYQGFFKHKDGDAVEMPVAVKTLPELSSSQAEHDFCMEAWIMSKFNHPNIVHFIGACFDKHPRFIVIELLAGGDLKTFLRETRPKPDKVSPLTMKDLLSCILDVAKGCKYLEEHRFIHRDIAARNCLLTSKGPGRVVKIADFGMARDIYRSEYYRKGGKAMLPIKWMPPEAYLDGTFTAKTDVWSFGVLMWEIMSMGYMPYTGCANHEVMTIVQSGGRLASPANCPTQIYGIMLQCWDSEPENRPSFGLLLERVGYCIQDPDVIKTPLPICTIPPSQEKDTTIMRPTALDDCIHPEYLIPLPGPVETWVLPQSRSTQPLLENNSTAVTETAIDNNNTAGIELSTITKTMNNGQPVFIVSSNVKKDAEVSC